MTAGTLLIADDDAPSVELATRYLVAEGFQVVAVADGEAAVEGALELRPDLVLLDVALPGVNGWEVCRQIWRESEVPIVLLTARNALVDKLVGLELGADDYVTKPFPPRELVARVKAILRRRQAAAGRHDTYRAGNLELSTAAMEARIDGVPVAVRGKTFALLQLLLEAQGQLVSRETMLRDVWGQEPSAGSRTVEVHLAWLRAQLRGAAIQIENVRGVGYRLVAGQVSRTSDAAARRPGTAPSASGTPRPGPSG